MSADRRAHRGKTEKEDRKAVSRRPVPGPDGGGGALGAAGSGGAAVLPGGTERSARGRGPRVGSAAHLPCDPAGGGAGLRGGALYLLQPLGGRAAVVVQALLFAGLHGSWTARAYALGMGLIFGWAARKARSVWPGCALHMINNCLVFAARLAERGMG